MRVGVVVTIVLLATDPEIDIVETRDEDPGLGKDKDDLDRESQEEDQDPMSVLHEKIGTEERGIIVLVVGMTIEIIVDVTMIDIIEKDMMRGMIEEEDATTESTKEETRGNKKRNQKNKKPFTFFILQAIKSNTKFFK